jgi:hypothetical protein
MTKWILAGTLVLAVGSAYAEEPKAKRAPKAAAASGQMFCNQQTCRPVAPGCHLEYKVVLNGPQVNVEVCK